MSYFDWAIAKKIPYCTFLVAGWLNLKIHTLLHPITPKLDVPLWLVMSSKSSKALVTMNSLNVCSCALIIHNTYTNVGWFLEVETDTHWLSTWLYLCLPISYQKNLKQALVYNHGFEKKSKSQKTYQREFFAGFFIKIDGALRFLK